MNKLVKLTGLGPVANIRNIPSSNLGRGTKRKWVKNTNPLDLVMLTIYN